MWARIILTIPWSTYRNIGTLFFNSNSNYNSNSSSSNSSSGSKVTIIPKRSVVWQKAVRTSVTCSIRYHRCPPPLLPRLHPSQPYPPLTSDLIIFTTINLVLYSTLTNKVPPPSFLLLPPLSPPPHHYHHQHRRHCHCHRRHQHCLISLLPPRPPPPRSTQHTLPVSTHSSSNSSNSNSNNNMHKTISHILP